MLNNNLYFNKSFLGTSTDCAILSKIEFSEIEQGVGTSSDPAIYITKDKNERSQVLIRYIISDHYITYQNTNRLEGTDALQVQTDSHTLSFVNGILISATKKS